MAPLLAVAATAARVSVIAARFAQTAIDDPFLRSAISVRRAYALQPFAAPHYPALRRSRKVPQGSDGDFVDEPFAPPACQTGKVAEDGRAGGWGRGGQ